MKSRTLVGCLSDLFLSVSVFGRFQALEAQEIWIYLNKSMILMPNVNKTWNILKHYSNNLHLQNWNMRMCIKHWHYLTVSFTESLSQHSDPHFLSDTPALRRGATILIHIHVHVYLITYIYILFISMYINIMLIFFLNMHIYIYIYIYYPPRPNRPLTPYYMGTLWHLSGNPASKNHHFDFNKNLSPNNGRNYQFLKWWSPDFRTINSITVITKNRWLTVPTCWFIRTLY